MTEMICENCGHEIMQNIANGEWFHAHNPSEGNSQSDIECSCGCKSPAPAQEVKE